MPGSRINFVPEALSVDRPVLAGRWDPQPDKASLHYHDSLEILWNRKPMTVVVDGQRNILRRPTVFLLPAQTVHIACTFRGRPACGQHGSHVAIGNECLESCGVAEGLRCGPLRRNHSVQVIPFLEFLSEQLSGSKGSDEGDPKRLVATLLLWLKHLGYGSPTSVAVSANPVQRAVDLVLSRYSDPDLTVKAMAGVARLSESHLRRLFVRAMKLSPQEFITRVRMDRARHLFANSRMKRAAVARTIGYSSVSAMYRHLRRVSFRPAPTSSNCSGTNT